MCHMQVYAMYVILHVILHFRYLIWNQHYMLTQIIDSLTIAWYSDVCLEQSILHNHFMLIDIPPHPVGGKGFKSW